MCKNPSQILQQKYDTGCRRVNRFRVRWLPLRHRPNHSDIYTAASSRRLLPTRYCLWSARLEFDKIYVLYFLCISAFVLATLWFHLFLAWQFMTNKHIRKTIYIDMTEWSLIAWVTNQVTKDAIAFWDNQALYLFDINGRLGCVTYKGISIPPGHPNRSQAMDWDV